MSQAESEPKPEPKPEQKKKKAVIKVHVLHCRGDECDALIPFEETSEGLLLGNMFGLATVDGDKRFFPCSKCGGHNLVEEVEHKGKIRSRVYGFESAVVRPGLG